MPQRLRTNSRKPHRRRNPYPVRFLALLVQFLGVVILLQQQPAVRQLLAILLQMMQRH